MITERMLNLVDSAVCDISKQLEEIIALMGTTQQRVGDMMPVNKNHSQVMSVTQVR